MTPDQSDFDTCPHCGGMVGKGGGICQICLHLEDCEQTNNHVDAFQHKNGNSTERNAAETVMLRLGLDVSDHRLRDKLIFDISPWIQVEREAVTVEKATQNRMRFLLSRAVECGMIDIHWIERAKSVLQALKEKDPVVRSPQLCGCGKTYSATGYCDDCIGG